jgi:DNA-directed RNA polymerase subunit RPC12/RpoP
MGIAIKCERCGLDLNHNIVTNSYSCLQCKSKRHCPTCRSELLFDEITHMHNCPYCHVGYKSEDLF